MINENGRLLYKFLQERGAYRRYLWNFWNYKGKVKYEKFPKGDKESIMRMLERYGIFSGFIWRDTPEGETFWSKLNNEFYGYKERYIRKRQRIILPEIVKTGRSTYRGWTDDILWDLL